ncbi:AgmX/PglI C-terminal domain-containing protein [Leptospira sp. GIMC2001]|uniref:AgmX/PglI C-terminal domain-containing protein n=1 Tax=Leptospira sp. GIMC2001 TaxID=1513297 RepID=UPI00234BF0D2|nr:AgmX/PglI C-terminal domain-containing protein [Leptospira sp. GIMC2001]WCL50544.1 AgmX/PglI C-terminal domain-containing protein [Leptospira sp. GIMC2001]
MKNQNKSIYILLVSIISLLIVLFFILKKQQDLQVQLIRSLDYKSSYLLGDQNNRSRDPYKEIAVNNALRKKANSIQECYNEYLKQKPDLTEGFVEIDWNIQENGSVKKAEIVSSNLSSDNFHRCILNTITKIEFPLPPTGMQTYATYKYNFKMDAETK